MLTLEVWSHPLGKYRTTIFEQIANIKIVA